MKHTPGPWNQMVKMNGFTAVGANTLIARVFSTAFMDLENERANALLIAAAPDLLAALKHARKQMQRTGFCFEMDDENGYDGYRSIDAAIAKAEGA